MAPEISYSRVGPLWWSTSHRVTRFTTATSRKGDAMTVKHSHSAAAPSDTATRGSCTVYFSRSLTRTLLTVAVLVLALVLIIALG